MFSGPQGIWNNFWEKRFVSLKCTGLLRDLTLQSKLLPETVKAGVWKIVSHQFNNFFLTKFNQPVVKPTNQAVTTPAQSLHKTAFFFQQLKRNMYCITSLEIRASRRMWGLVSSETLSISLFLRHWQRLPIPPSRPAIAQRLSLIYNVFQAD